MSVTQITLGRFHHFHLARQLQAHGLLKQIWTGYPRFQLKDEQGIPADKIKSFPWFQAAFMVKGRLRFPPTPRLDRELLWHAHTTLDRQAQKSLENSKALIALSGCGLAAGKAVKEAGGIYYCDRGSTHIRFQNDILREEHALWGEPFKGIDPRMIEREEAEYATANVISVPSKFVANSFIAMGVSESKLFVNPYGARLERFRRTGAPLPSSFTVLFVGEVSLRKGFPYLLDAFRRLRVAQKQLKVIGHRAANIKGILSRANLSDVEFLGQVPNRELSAHYSSAHVMVLPSIEEGLAMVIGEAMACGCPVIATANTGADDFLADGTEGYIVPPRSADAILLRLEELSDKRSERVEMSRLAELRTQKIGGWNNYGEHWANELLAKCKLQDFTHYQATESSSPPRVRKKA